MPSVLHPDPFAPVLLASESLVVSQEQRTIIQDILNKACSDSAFAKKAYAAIVYTLEVGSVNPPMLTSLSPDTVVLGSESFVLHVMGTGFDQFSRIMFAGQEEETTVVSDTELTTIVNMAFWQGPDSVSVFVESPVVASDPLMFTFTDPIIESSSDGLGPLSHSSKSATKMKSLKKGYEEESAK